MLTGIEGCCCRSDRYEVVIVVTAVEADDFSGWVGDPLVEGLEVGRDTVGLVRFPGVERVREVQVQCLQTVRYWICVEHVALKQFAERPWLASGGRLLETSCLGRAEGLWRFKKQS